MEIGLLKMLTSVIDENMAKFMWLNRNRTRNLQPKFSKKARSNTKVRALSNLRITRTMSIVLAANRIYKTRIKTQRSNRWPRSKLKKNFIASLSKVTKTTKDKYWFKILRKSKLTRISQGRWDQCLLSKFIIQRTSVYLSAISAKEIVYQ